MPLPKLRKVTRSESIPQQKSESIFSRRYKIEEGMFSLGPPSSPPNPFPRFSPRPL